MQSPSTLSKLLALFGKRFLRSWRNLPLDIFLEVLTHFTLLEVAIITGCDVFAAYAHAELRRRVRALLETWSLDVDSTLKVMDRTQSVMSGSAVVLLCQPGDWEPGDLDFYCPKGALAEVVKHFEGLGYTIETTGSGKSEDGVTQEPRVDGYCKDLLQTVVRMWHGGRRKINVIESSVPSAVAPLFLFHSTVVMNAVTGSGIVCFHPQLTLNMKGVANHPSGRQQWLKNELKETALLDKYRVRGFDVQEDCRKHHKGGSSECLVCSAGWTRWRDSAVYASFIEGEQVELPGPQVMWKAGGYGCKVERTGLPGPFPSIRTIQRGAVVLILDRLYDGKAYLYDGRPASDQYCFVSSSSRLGRLQVDQGTASGHPTWTIWRKDINALTVGLYWH
ncbi:hypothetical protein NMY22_g9034 [Coprinellus aureogranulatus]|nr:hypothetical protein NMY22_g9034 [Coprinellus aureogranulatus]